jgi:hypothetical protein
MTEKHFAAAKAALDDSLEAATGGQTAYLRRHRRMLAPAASRPLANPARAWSPIRRL